MGIVDHPDAICNDADGGCKPAGRNQSTVQTKTYSIMEQTRMNEELKQMILQIGFGALICGALMAFIYVAMLLATSITGVY